MNGLKTRTIKYRNDIMEDTHLKKIRKSTRLLIVLFSLVAILSTQMSYAAEASEDTYGKILADVHLITGFNGDLMEEKNISRVEMIAIISKFYASEFKAFVPPTIPTFDDVKATHWGYKYVEFAFKKGITTGKSTKILA